MPQYVIIARDGSDEKALERRMTARPSHFETARRLKAEEHFIIGGALLDEQGQMNGSVMIVSFDDEAQLQEWLRNEPYINGHVWEQVEIKPFRVADI